MRGDRGRPAWPVVAAASAGTTLLVVAMATALAAAQPAATVAAAANAAFDQLSSIHRPSEVALSPDGARVAWIDEAPRARDAVTTRIVIAPTAGGAGPSEVRLGDEAAGFTARGLAWAPEGPRLAFLSDAGSPGQVQVQVANASGGAPRRLTSVKGELGTPRWSPDGARIAFLFTENARAAAGPVAAKPTETGVIGDHMDVQRIATVD